MRDQMAQRNVTARNPFVQNRTAKQPDRIRPKHLLAQFLWQGRAVIQSRQLERVIYIQLLQHGIGREVDDLHGNRFGMGGKRLWQLRNRRRDQRQKIGVIWGQVVGPERVVHAHGLACARGL